jgi:alpha-beta hydrolase superfamily lysophospholipase
MDSLFLKTSEVRIPYYTWKVENCRAVLIFLHGLKSHAGWFLDAGEGLAARGIRVYAFDRRGSGRSSEPRGDIGDYRKWLEDIRAVTSLVREENPGLACHLLGHCFGAKQALAFSLAYPGEVRSLILVAPPHFSLKADLTVIEKLKALLGWIAGRDMKIPVPVEDEMFTQDPEKLRFIREDALRLLEMTPRLCMETFKMDRWVRKRHFRFAHPVLIMLARYDEVIDPFRAQKKFYPRLRAPEKGLEIYEARHDLFFEPCKEKVLDRIAGWILGQS